MTASTAQLFRRTNIDQDMQVQISDISIWVLLDIGLRYAGFMVQLISFFNP